MTAPELFLNPRADRGRGYGGAEREIVNRVRAAAARRTIAAWPGYAPTPLVALPGLAAELGLGAVLYKDESGRFGIGSFKALGGAYAVCRSLARVIARRKGLAKVGADALLAGDHRDLAATITVATATDGNHGRSVAWGARTFGCRAAVYLPASVSAERQAVIAGFGAKVVAVDGTFDDAVARAAEDAAARGWLLIADTAPEDESEVPRDVMQGYTVMAEEIVERLAGEPAPTHAFVQAGVGGLAAAVCGHLWESWGADRPCFVVVEPVAAACCLASARAGRPVTIEGDLATVMGGLAAGRPSRPAWRILEHGAAAFLAIADEAALCAMVTLAAGDPPIVAGESGAAGVAGLIAAAGEPQLGAALGLDGESRVLVIGSEGATDPGLYRRYVGRDAESVLAGTAP